MASVMGTDSVTTEVIRGLLDAVTDEMQSTLIKTSHSPLITESRDATAAIFDARGRTTAQATAVPVHLGVLAELGRRFAKRYPEGVAEDGDLYIINDPYAGGTHLPDFALAAPVFFDEQLVGYVGTMVHHRDIGGMAPTSVNVEARDIHAEGLRLPMIRLARGGAMNESVYELITANTRTPRMIRGDLGAQIAACKTGVRQLRDVYRRRSSEVVDASVEVLMDYAERLTALRSRRFPMVLTALPINSMTMPCRRIRIPSSSVRR